jgi:hypothetical protein
MIVFDLKCQHDHVFEAWFKDSEAFDLQASAGEVACPVCGETEVEKSLMAPNVSTRSGPPAKMVEHVQRYVAAAREIRRQVEENCEYVGENFPDEARKIHYGETEERGIFGEATDNEAAALTEEGVEIQAIPWAPREDA